VIWGSDTVFKSMMASRVQGLGAAKTGMPQINGNSIIGIPKRDHGIVEHGIVEHCTDSARDCQLGRKALANFAIPLRYENVRQLCSVGLCRIVAETRGGHAERTKCRRSSANPAAALRYKTARGVTTKSSGSPQRRRGPEKSSLLPLHCCVSAVKDL
jgi:hypothetical protein